MMAERPSEGASGGPAAPSRFRGAKNAVPKIAPLFKTNTLSEIPSHGFSFKPVVSPSPPDSSSAERVAAGQVRVLQRIMKPGTLKKQYTHGGEHNPNWRTRQAFAARPKVVEPPALEATLDSIDALVVEEKRNISESSMPEEVAEMSELTAQIFARKLRESDPKLLGLPVEDFVASTDIVITPKRGMDIESEIIGEGGQGTIFRAQLRDRSSQPVAVKVGHSLNILEEYIVARKFTHPSILRAVAFSIAPDVDEYNSMDESDSDCDSRHSGSQRSGAGNSATSTESYTTLKKKQWVYMAVYEYCSNGDLFSFISKNPRKARDVVFLEKLFLSLLHALAHIHKLGYVHCDLKPENVLITADEEARLADFGMSQPYSDDMIAQGTPSFLAPEVVDAWFNPREHHTFTDKIDIFSMGAMAIYIITGKYPFGRITARLRSGIRFSQLELGAIFTANQKRLAEVAVVSPTLSRLIALCIANEPTARPSAQALLDMLGA